MNKIFTLFAILLLLPVAAISQTKAEKEAIKQAVAQRDKYLFAVKPLQKNFIYTLPYESHLGQIIVPVVIRGEIYRFLWDTGATSVVSPELKDKLGMKNVFSNKLSDGSGQVEEQPMYAIGQVQLGPVVFKDVVGPALDMKKFEKMFCIKLDGIFGTNIMRTCHWKIDYKAKTITFSDKKIKPEGEVIEIDFTEGFSGSPMIRQVIGQYSYYSTMDTGYNGGFSIRDSLFFNSRKSKGARIVIGRGKSAMTLFESKTNYEYAVQLDSIEFGNHLMKNQFLNVTAGDSYLTGNAVFEKFGSVILDWKKHRLYLPVTVLKDDNEFKTFGLSPLYLADELKVGMVWDGSLAGTEGVEAGDAILSINGIPANAMPREKWCEIVEIFSNEDINKPLPIVIRIKDGTEKQLVLKKTDLFKR